MVYGASTSFRDNLLIPFSTQRQDFLFVFFQVVVAKMEKDI